MCDFMDSNLTIQKEKSLVNAVYRLTLDEQRLFHYAIAKVNPFRYKNGDMYQISISDVIKFYGVGSGDAYQHLYGALNRLFDRKCTYYDPEKKSWITCHLVARIMDNKKGVVGFSFTDEIGDLISSDKDFLSYKLSQTVNITSVNANRLYEILLFSLQRCPVNKLTKKMSIDELKKLMGLSDKYERFFHFKDRVLEVSESQINKHTDIRMRYEVIKEGRTPSHIKFTAQFKKGQEPNAVEFQNELPIDGENHSEDKIDSVKAKEYLANIKSTFF